MRHSEDDAVHKKKKKNDKRKTHKLAKSAVICGVDLF